MATSSSGNQTRYHEEHIPMCKKHDLTIDMICEDCGKLICSKCVKLDHMDHKWDTIAISASLRRRELKEYLLKITKEIIGQLDNKIEATAKQMEDNKASYKNEVLKLQNHYDAIVKEVNEIKEEKENSLKDSLDEKKSELCKNKSDLENKKKEAMDLVGIVEEKNRAMSDYILIHNLRCIENLMSNTGNDEQKVDYSTRYIKGDFNEKILEFVMGRTCADVSELDLDITKDPLQNYYGFFISFEHAFNKKCSIL